MRNFLRDAAIVIAALLIPTIGLLAVWRAYCKDDPGQCYFPKQVKSP